MKRRIPFHLMRRLEGFHFGRGHEKREGDHLLLLRFGNTWSRPLYGRDRGRPGGRSFSKRGGRICERWHAIPRNPHSDDQRENRSRFTGAVRRLRAPEDEERGERNRKSADMMMSGYRRFQIEYLRSCNGAHSCAEGHESTIRPRRRTVIPRVAARIGIRGDKGRRRSIRSMNVNHRPCATDINSAFPSGNILRDQHIHIKLQS